MGHAVGDGGMAGPIRGERDIGGNFFRRHLKLDGLLCRPALEGAVFDFGDRARDPDAWNLAQTQESIFADRFERFREGDTRDFLAICKGSERQILAALRQADALQVCAIAENVASVQNDMRCEEACIGDPRVVESALF